MTDKTTKITVLERRNDWTAFVGGEQLMQELGPSPCAALGALILANPERFRVDIDVREAEDAPAKLIQETN